MAQIITINGEPALVFEWKPNWRNPISRTLEYKTDIFTSGTGIEQRRALRHTPRQSFEFTLTRGNGDYSEMMATVAGWQRRLYLLPDPVRWGVSRLPMVASSAVIVLDEVPAWFQEGSHVLLGGSDRAEYRAVSSIQGDEVLFASASDSVWPVGTKVHLLRPARLLSGASARQYTQSVMESNLDFSVEPTFDQFRVLGGFDGDFDGLEVLLKKPNWATPLDLTFNGSLDVLDYGYGPIQVDSPTGFSGRVQRSVYLNRDLEETDHIEAFFHRMKGRRGTFYMPTWTTDIKPVLPLQEGSQQMVVDTLTFAQMFIGDPANRRVAVMTKDGSIIYNKLTAVNVLEGGYGNDYGLSYGLRATNVLQTVLSFRDPWEIDIPVSQVLRVSWLMACRLASDSLTFTHETVGVSTFQLTTEQIRDADESTRDLFGWGYNYGYGYGGAAP